MPSNRWLDRTQPQTLYIAVILLYINAVFGLIAGFSLIGLAIAAGQVGAGWGIANEKKWGYFLGLVMAFLPFIIRLLFVHNPFATTFINLMFEVAMVALLLHPQSREYQRIWFK
jgi:uncharacterized membrane protein (DUF2068 family)